MHLNMDQLKIYLPASLMVLAAFILAYQFVDPAPPSHIRFSTGQAGGAYQAYAKAYQQALKGYGIDVELVESSGSIENIQRLKQGEVDIAFVQSGIIQTPSKQQLLSLGSMYYEPLWIFVRDDLHIQYLSELKGKRINIGLQGSGTQALALKLLQDNGINPHNTKLLEFSSAKAIQNQQAIDAIFMVAGTSSSSLQQLQNTAGIHLMNITRAQAYTRRMESLSNITIPQGALNLQDNIPARDTQLLASTATLLIQQNLHPALQALILQTAQKIHHKHQLLAKQNIFPSPLHSDVALSSSAEHFYQSGPSFLQRFLPFHTAVLLDRLKVMLLPLLALILPLMKVMPPLYRWRIRSRIYRWYKKLSQIDTALNKGFSTSLLDDLDQIEDDIRKVHVPLSYAVELYDLRLHLSLVRANLEKAQQADA